MAWREVAAQHMRRAARLIAEEVSGMPQAARRAWRNGKSRLERAKAGSRTMFDWADSMTSSSAGARSWIETSVNSPIHGTRMLLWVDAVGGFFVCLGTEIRIGQAVPGAAVEIPLLADLSRHHATIRRDEEGYTIEPIRDVRLNHERIRSTSWLTDGSLIELGGALQMRFRRPHSLSATARLDFVSNHRTQPSATAVLLMADTCVLGPGGSNHVVCRDWPQDIVLHRQHGGLYCRTAGRLPMEIDGRPQPGGGPLTLHSRVSGEDFSFSLEEI
jgi:FHA domain